MTPTRRWRARIAGAGLTAVVLVTGVAAGVARGAPASTPTPIAISASPVPSVGELAEPTILPLVIRVEALDGSETTTSVGEETTLALSSDVYFEFGSAQLTSDAARRLEELTDELASVEGSVDVVGHTDNVGRESVNGPLSLQRAEAVATELRRLAPDIELSVDGRGSSEPVAANTIDGRDNPEGRARNRRVEVIYGG